VRAEVAVVKAPSFYRYAHSFSHLFDGGYAAGFYGYAWAEVMSADAYAAFEEAGLDNPEVRSRYRRNILETGGSRSMLDNFKAFRGREPLPDALFRHQGMG
jgi:oligopeptidase A